MKQHMVDAVTLVDGKPDARLESFAVFFDSLRKFDPGYFRFQKRVLLAGAVLAAAGLVVLALVRAVLLEGAGLVVVGGVLMVFFFRAKPKRIRVLRKVFWPFGVYDVPGEAGTRPCALVDSSGKLWSSVDVPVLDESSAILTVPGKMPAEFETFGDEVSVLSTLGTLSSGVRDSPGEIFLQSDPSVSGLVQLSRETEEGPPQSIPPTDEGRIERMVSLLGDHLERSKRGEGLMSAAEEAVRERTAAYAERLRSLERSEEEYMGGYALSFLGLSDNVPTFFDPIIESFTEDLRDELNRIERGAEREMARVEDQMRSDKLTLQSLTDNAMLQLEEVINQIYRQIKLTEIQREALARTRDAIRSAAKTATESLDGAVQDAKKAVTAMQEAGRAGELKGEGARELGEAPGKSPEEQAKIQEKKFALDFQKGRSSLASMGHPSTRGDVVSEGEKTRAVTRAEAEKVREEVRQVRQEVGVVREEVLVEGQKSRAWTSLESARTRKQIAEVELRQYEVMGTHIAAQLEAVDRQIALLQDQIAEVASRMRVVYAQMKGRIAEVLKAGTDRLRDTLDSREQDLELVRRHLSYLQEARDHFIDIDAKAMEMIEEEGERHIAPYERRAAAFEREAGRIGDVLAEMRATVDRFTGRVQRSLLVSEVRGLVWVPFWLVGYEENRSVKYELYSLSDVGGDGRLQARWQGLAFPASSFVEWAPKDYVEGFDDGRSLKSGGSRKEFTRHTRVGFLDSLVCERGLSNIAK
jgi:hypothetical protein